MYNLSYESVGTTVNQTHETQVFLSSYFRHGKNQVTHFRCLTLQLESTKQGYRYEWKKVFLRPFSNHIISGFLCSILYR